MTKRLRRFLAVFVSTCLAATWVVVSAAPASADPPSDFIGSLDATQLDAYCIYAGYADGAFLGVADDAYAWNCRSTGESSSPITPTGDDPDLPTMAAACAWTYDNNATYPFASAADDPTSWGCYVPVITSSANPSVVGDPVTFTATMNPAAQNQDSSSYFFANDTTYLATITDGVASATIAAADLPEGTDNVGVVLRYTGLPGDNSGEAEAGYAQVVNAPPVLTPTTTALASSTNPSTAGQPVTFTATVTPSTATGTVNFVEGTTVLGSGTLSGGHATFTTSSLSAATHCIKAVYLGNASYATSPSAQINQVVHPAPITTTTALASSANPSNSGQPVTFTATVTPSTATGTVNFVEGTTVLGSGTLSGGHATFTTSSLSAATHSIKAVYLGNASYATSPSTPISQVVNPPTTTTTACAADSPCSAAVTIPGKEAASVTAQSSTPGTLTLALDTNNISCGDPFRHSPSMATISDAGLNVTSDKMVKITIDKSVVFGPGAPWLIPYAVCYSSPTPFKNVLGKTTTLGLLPVCGDNDNFWGLAWLRHRAAPCVESITLDRLGNVTETVRLPAYDPRMH